MSASAKAAAMVFLSLAMLRLPLPALAILTVIAAAAPFPLGIRPRGPGRGAVGIAVLLAGAALAQGLFPGDGRLFAPETLGTSAMYALRIAGVLLVSRLYFTTTRASELGDSATRFARRFARRFGWRFGRRSGWPIARASGGDTVRWTGGRGLAERIDPGISVGLTLLFLPRGFDRYRRVREAADIRGLGNGAPRPAAILALLESFVFASLKGALATARAMELRCYGPDRDIPEGHLSMKDVALVTGAFAVFVCSLAL